MFLCLLTIPIWYYNVWQFSRLYYVALPLILQYWSNLWNVCEIIVFFADFHLSFLEALFSLSDNELGVILDQEDTNNFMVIMPAVPLSILLKFMYMITEKYLII